MGPGNLDQRELRRAIADMRVDPTAWEHYTLEDIKDMLDLTYRSYESGTLRDPQQWNRGGTTPGIANYMGQASQINVIKMMKLAMINREMWKLYGDLMGGRQANNIDHVIGRELDGLIAAEPDAELDPLEARRMRRKHAQDPDSIWCAVCKYWWRDRECKKGAYCEAWHVDH